MFIRVYSLRWVPTTSLRGDTASENIRKKTSKNIRKKTSKNVRKKTSKNIRKKMSENVKYMIYYFHYLILVFLLLIKSANLSFSLFLIISAHKNSHFLFRISLINFYESFF